MAEQQLVSLSKEFAIDVINLCEESRKSKKGEVLINQLLRSGTSIGANIHEAYYAASKADFVNKLQIALKECYETEYWLEIFKETTIIDEEHYKALSGKCKRIRSKLIASINTAKSGI